VLAVLTAPAAGGEVGEPFRFADPATPLVSVLDLGVTRGDGVFETLGVGGGRAQALDAHLARLARSAAMLELPEPDEDAWRAATIAVAERLAGHREAFVKLVYTRGVEGTGQPTGWALGAPSPDHSVARTNGVRVTVLDRGLQHDSAGELPWLLQGAKTLSYAVNMAAVREAKRRDVDDALFVSSDGYLLEGPTSNLLVKRGDRLVTPSTSLGILAGTTQAEAFRFARGEGMTTSYEMLPREVLETADALWLLSSVRNAAPIREVDGVARPIDAALTAALNAHLLARRD
jgi:4-amino-4-deoxychorismate lyase